MSDKSKRCVLFVTFRPSQRTLFMARRNWVPLALITLSLIWIFISCLTSTVNSLGHVGTVSYPKHNFPGQALPKRIT